MGNDVLEYYYGDGIFAGWMEINVKNRESFRVQISPKEF